MVQPSHRSKYDMSIALTKCGLVGWVFKANLAGPRDLWFGRPVELKRRTGPADRDLPFATHVVDQLALPAKRHGFRRITSCNISLSSGPPSRPGLAAQALPERCKFQAVRA